MKKLLPTLSRISLTALAFVICASNLVQGQIISTVAGKGGAGYNSDGIPATQAQLNFAASAIVDGSGNIYIADQYNNRIRKVNASGVISTFAGTGAYGFSGDGGAATAAKLYAPCSLVFNAGGDMIVLDRFNQRVRKINTSGVITTIAGNGSASYGGDGGQATAASINNAIAICLDAGGNLFISDAGNARIRKVSSGGVITTFAGTGSFSYSGDGGQATAAAISGPQGILADGAGNILFCDMNNNRVRKIAASGVITTFAGMGSSGFSGDGGAATAAHISTPTGIAKDSYGCIYFADRDNNRIRKVSTSGIITTIAGTGASGYNGDGIPATTATFYIMFGLSIDGANNLYVADEGNGRIRKIDTTGNVISVAGMGNPGFSGDGGAATAGQLFSPVGVKVDAAFNVYIADKDNGRVRKRDAAGNITTIAGTGSISSSGDGGPATSAGLSLMHGIAVDRAGNVYVSEGSGKIRIIDTAGIIRTFAGIGSGGYTGDGGAATAARINTPMSVAADKNGNIYIADFGNYRVRKVDTAGIITTIAGNGTMGYSGDGYAATAAQIYPTEIDVDTFGNIYLCEGNRIRMINTSGIINTVAGTGVNGFSGDGASAVGAKINAATGVAVDAAGNIFIADYENNRIRKVNTSGIISTIAGSAAFGWNGDGGMASAATFYHPQGIATDRYGNVYSSELFDHVVRKITYCTAPVVGPIRGSFTVCKGDSILLTDTTAGGHWTSSNPGIGRIGTTTGWLNGLSAGTTTVTYTLVNSCDADTATEIITVKALPFAGVITGPDSLCPGEVRNFSDTASGGTWRSANNVTATISGAGVVTAGTSGTVNILYIVSNECGSDTAFFPLVVRNSNLCPDGVIIPGSQLGFSVAPNPSKGTFVVSYMAAGTEPEMLTITNLMGMKVREQLIWPSKENAVQLNVPAGIYFLSAVIGGERVVREVVVE